MATKKQAATAVVRRGSTAAKRELEKARASLATRARKARESRNANKAMMVQLGGAFALGYAQRRGILDRIPDMGGVPKLAIAGVGMKIGGKYASGTLGDVLEGIGDSALTVQLYQWGEAAGAPRVATPAQVQAARRGRRSSGVGDVDEDRAAALERRFARELAAAKRELAANVSGYDDDDEDDVGDWDDEDDVGDWDDEDDVGDVYDVAGAPYETSGAMGAYVDPVEATDFGY